MDFLTVSGVRHETSALEHLFMSMQHRCSVHSSEGAAGEPRLHVLVVFTPRDASVPQS